MLDMLFNLYSYVASAQLINFNKGFRKDSLGLSGEINLAFMDRRGNTEYVDITLLLMGQFQTEIHRIRLIGEGDYRTNQGDVIEEIGFVHLRHDYRFLS